MKRPRLSSLPFRCVRVASKLEALNLRPSRFVSNGILGYDLVIPVSPPSLTENLFY